MKSPKRYSIVNHQVLDNIDSEFTMYFLGFMYADGCINLSKNRPNFRGVSITQTVKDFDVVKKISDVITPGYVFSTQLRDNCVEWRVNDSNLYSKLEEFGLTPNKSLTIGFPKLGYKNKRHFIRGLIDGDGWVTNDKDNTFIVGFCGNPMMVEGMYEFCLIELGIKGILYTKNENNHKLIFKGDKAITFAKYIYNDSEFFLKRKKEKFEEFEYIYKKRRQGYFKSKQVALIDNNKNILKTFHSAKEAADVMGLVRSSVQSVASGRRNSVNNYKFKYLWQQL